MTGDQRADGDPALHTPREAQQADGVGDGGSAATEAGGELLVRDVKVREQLLVRGRLLKGVQVVAVDVLEQGVPEQVVVFGRPDDGGNAIESGSPGSPDASLSHDELPPVAVRSNHDRLEHADRLDARAQLGQRLFIERPSRLSWVAVDLVEGKLAEGWSTWLEPVSIRCRRRPRRCLAACLRAFILDRPARGDKCFKSTAKTATASHQVAPSAVGASN